MAKKVINISSAEQPSIVTTVPKKTNKKKKKKKEAKKVDSNTNINTDQPTIETQPEDTTDTFWDDLESDNATEPVNNTDNFSDQKTMASPDRIAIINKAIKTEYLKASGFAVVAGGTYYAQYKGHESSAIKLLSLGSVLLLITSMVRINSLQKTKQSFAIHGFADPSDI